MSITNITNFKKVCIFNSSFGLPHYDSYQSNILDNESLANLRINLCKEEVEELNEAFNTSDLIEVIDALTDILYVAYGAGSSFGVDLDREFKNKLINMYYLKNIDKSKSNYELLKHYIEYDKIINYIPSNLNLNLFKSPIETKISEILRELNNIIVELENEKQEKNLSNIVKLITSLLYYSYKMGIYIGINLDESFTIVHDSNMSKLCRTIDEAEDTVKWYKENQTRYDSPNYRKSDYGDYYVVFNEYTGKILKSINYTPANFARLMNNNNK
jgi:predicted HAD superfamily Cof-like phosphohydrolase